MTLKGRMAGRRPVARDSRHRQALERAQGDRGVREARDHDPGTVLNVHLARPKHLFVGGRSTTTP